MELMNYKNIQNNRWFGSQGERKQGHNSRQAEDKSIRDFLLIR